MANSYNTTNPLGSNSLKDLSDNAVNFDLAMNSDSPSFPDRFGHRRETWAGMEQAFADFLAASGFESTHLVYTDGQPLTVVRPTQLIDRASSIYRVKMPATFPVTLTGTWGTDAAKLTDVGDAALRQQLSAPDGAAYIGALAQTQAKKNRESVSIRDYGGGEEVADNLAAFNSAKAAVGLGGLIRFPKLGDGVYRFPTGFVDFSVCVLDPDPGVTISGRAVPGFFASTTVTTTDFTIAVTEGDPKDYKFEVKANFWRGSKGAQKELWLSEKLVSDTIPTALVPSSQLIFKQIALGLNDAVTSFTPAGSSADSLFLQPPSGGNTQLGCYPLRPGDELVAAVNNTPDNAGEIAAGVIWSTGYAVLRGYPTAGTWSLSSKYAGQPATDFSVTPDGGATPGYSPLQNILSVRFISAIRFQILISGVVAVDFQITSGYLMLGGIGATTISTTSSSNFTGWQKRKFTVANSPRSRVLGFVGDSLTDDLHGAWPWWCANALDGSLGIRVNGIENRAISGQTTQQQLANLTANPFVNASDVAVFLGTNDIQGANSLAGFKTSYKALIDLLLSQGRSVTLVIPPLWYTQAQSGGGGGASLRAQYGGDIRAAIGRFAADYGLQLADLSRVSGPINAAYLNSTFADPMLRDNVHQTSYFNKICGFEIAKAFAASMCPVVRTVGDWVTLPGSLYASGFSGTLQFRTVGDDVEIRGSVTGTFVAGGSPVLTLQDFLIPKALVRSSIFGGATAGIIDFSTSGQLVVAGLTGSLTATIAQTKLTYS